MALSPFSATWRDDLAKLLNAVTGALVGTTGTQTLTHKDLTSATNTFPTFNQNTTGSAAKLTTARNIDGQAFDGSANITVIAPGTHAATGKTTPADDDELALVDSAASNVLKKLTIANLRASLIESGTWTPTVEPHDVAFSSIVYTAQYGLWVSLNLGAGNYLVLAMFSLNFTPTIGSASGALSIEGLFGTWTPDTSIGNAPGFVGNINSAFNWTANRTVPCALITSGGKLRTGFLGTGEDFTPLDVVNLTDSAEHAISASVIFLATKA